LTCQRYTSLTKTVIMPSHRQIFGILSLTIVLSSIFLLSKLTAVSYTQPSYHTDLAATVIFSFGAAILFAWLASGLPGASAATAVSAIYVLVFCLRTGFAGYPLIGVLFVSTLIGYAYGHDKSTLDAAVAFKLEKLDEEMNVLLNKIVDGKKRISSLGEKSNKYSALKNVAESLSTTLSIDEINKLVVASISKTLQKEGRALLFLVNAEKQELALSASAGDMSVRAKKGDIFDQWVLRHRKSLIVEDVTYDFRFPADNAGESRKLFRSLITSPLISENKVIGILRMDGPRESAYTQDDLRLLDIIAGFGAVAIQNAQLYSRTQELAIKDGLTGLFVRRHFMERFRKELSRAARKKGVLSLLILDIDNFKEYNDRFGHMAGDIVLKYIARLLNSAVRGGDIVARYGGEEMVVLLCDRNKKEAVQEAEKIRKVLKKSPLTLRRQTAAVTVSGGLAVYPDDATLEEELIRIADERLYKAKAAGRDKICSA